MNLSKMTGEELELFLDGLPQSEVDDLDVPALMAETTDGGASSSQTRQERLINKLSNLWWIKTCKKHGRCPCCGKWEEDCE